MAVDGKALTAVGIGALFVWSGVKGWSVLGTVSDVIQGKVPTQAVANQLTTGAEAAAPLPSGLGGAEISGSLTSIALSYKGHAYSFGGAPGQDGSRPWDCSSFCNFCIGVRLHQAIPGYGPGKYDGSVHGPPTGAWGVWPGITRISRGEVAGGDLIVWLNHMGIALDNNTMISALNANAGTQVTPIEGHGNGPILAYGRLGGSLPKGNINPPRLA